MKRQSLSKASFSAALLLLAGAVSASADPTDVHDLAVLHGRVIDPESGIDGLRHVGIKDGRISAVSEQTLKGVIELDATGLVVAPGFIEIHSHAINIPSTWMQAFDGVTTALELERGAWPLDKAYDEVAEKGLPLNYGFSVSWIDARLAALGEKQFDTLVPPEKSMLLVDLVEEGLEQGGVGIGLLPGYLPESNRVEFYEMARLAAKYDVPTFTHVRSKFQLEPNGVIESFGEVIAAAAATGAHMHICHVSSVATRSSAKVVDMIRTAQQQGLRITTENHPYGAGSTVIGAPFLWPENHARVGISSTDIVYLKTGERPAGAARLAEIQASDPTGWSIIHYLDMDDPADRAHHDTAMLFPDTIIASDAMPYTIDGEDFDEPVWPLPDKAVSHPRSAGTFARVMGHYVRERGVFSLPEAIRRSTLLPARLLENAAPQMRNKGRLKIGADADVVIFDDKTIIDRATYDNPRLHSVGVQHLLVNGEFVIREGTLQQEARPGRPVRGPMRHRQDSNEG
ncbi:amidohydrolase family protein [Geminicoccaceae bacterium 1502E]|nr:amidohydrolase family protein [Geminicoccaceae bacterium 1502E]